MHFIIYKGREKVKELDSTIPMLEPGEYFIRYSTGTSDILSFVRVEPGGRMEERMMLAKVGNTTMVLGSGVPEEIMREFLGREELKEKHGLRQAV